MTTTVFTSCMDAERVPERVDPSPDQPIGCEGAGGGWSGSDACRQPQPTYLAVNRHSDEVFHDR